ncbi:MAG: 50S ribosomal protein L23 [Candidatus Andersenbacteria bacterium]
MAWFWQRNKQEAERKEQQAATKEKRASLGKQPTGTPAVGGKAATKKAGAPATAAAATPTADRVLLGPVVTEKAARLAERGTYVFAVARHATKIEVTRAVRELYAVHPTRVAVLNSQRKPKVFAQKYGRRAATRKAYVTLTAGESIELFKS